MVQMNTLIKVNTMNKTEITISKKSNYKKKYLKEKKLYKN